jgi:hypothetical protein
LTTKNQLFWVRRCRPLETNLKQTIWHSWVPDALNNALKKYFWNLLKECFNTFLPMFCFKNNQCTQKKFSLLSVLIVKRTTPVFSLTISKIWQCELNIFNSACVHSYVVYKQGDQIGKNFPHYMCQFDSRFNNTDKKQP